MSAARKKDAPPPDPRIKPLQDRFHDQHVARYGFKPAGPGNEYGRFARGLKEFLAAGWDEETLARLIDYYFDRRNTDPRVMRSDGLMSEFLRLATHLRQRLDGAPQLDRRTLDNLDAANRAAGGR
jgi:hypothetical protein